MPAVAIGIPSRLAVAVARCGGMLKKSIVGTKTLPPAMPTNEATDPQMEPMIFPPIILGKCLAGLGCH